MLLLNNWTTLKADQFIVGRVPSETKARLRVLAERQQLSESALLRRLVECVLLKAGLSPTLTELPLIAWQVNRTMTRVRVGAFPKMINLTSPLHSFGSTRLAG